MRENLRPSRAPRTRRRRRTAPACPKPGSGSEAVREPACQPLAPLVGHEQQILDASAADAAAHCSGLDRDHVPRTERVGNAQADQRFLMDLQADAVSKAVVEAFA